MRSRLVVLDEGDENAWPGTRGRHIRRDQGTGRRRDDDADCYARDGAREATV